MRYILFFTIACLICDCRSGDENGEKMPSFEILLPDGTTRLNTMEIKEGSPIALLYFSPSCEHCQAETESIIQHMDSLKSVRFYFITNEDFEEMKKFKAYYKLDKYPNISIGRDDQFFMIRHFKGIIPPSTILYDKDKNQRQIFNGQTSGSDLAKLIYQL